MTPLPPNGRQVWESSHEVGKQLLQQPTLEKAWRLLSLVFGPTDGRRRDGEMIYQILQGWSLAPTLSIMEITVALWFLGWCPII